MRNKNLLLKKIREKSCRIGVIGLGYVGLPLAILLAKEKFHVDGFVKTSTSINKIKNGLLQSQNLKKDVIKLQKSGLLSVQRLSLKKLSKCDAIIICLPTPVDAKKRPDLSALKKLSSLLKKISLKNKLIINESTVAPFTTRSLFGNIGQDYFLACSPERIDPGNESKTLERIPKLMGGIDEESRLLSSRLYKSVLKKTLIPVESMEIAEMSKMLENTYRAVNIALVNEFAILCDRLKIDVTKVLRAADTKWSFHIHYPGIGVGGHCIPVDPYYVLDLAQQHNIDLSMVKNSLKVNENMPRYVLDKIKKHYKKKMKIFIYGLSYKKNVADLRESPVLKLCSLLTSEKLNFTVYDPLLTKRDIRNLGLKYGNPNKCDIFVVGTDHSSLKNDYKKFVNKDTVVIDGKNYFSKKVGKNVIGVGRLL